MLVLSRRLGQQVVIADRVVVTVLEISGRFVRLGIEAPAEIRVDRKEVVEKRSLEEQGISQPE